jgi:hypothetical protein
MLWMRNPQSSVFGGRGGGRMQPTTLSTSVEIRVKEETSELGGCVSWQDMLKTMSGGS